MLGTDITSISRFKNAQQALINKFLHPEEIKLLATAVNKAKFLAARWAIKEALFKTNDQLSSFQKINVIKKGCKYEYPGYLISTSAEGDYYIAIVIKI